MKKVTFLFTALILFIGMFSIVQSCQKEEVEPQEQTTYPFKVIPINQNSVNINSKLTHTINKVSDLITEKTQTKSVYSEIYDFYIITEKGNYIESSDGKYHSYTFPIVRRNDIGKIENILFSLQEDGKYKVVLISYNLTQEELEDYNSRGSVDISNKITYTAILDESLVDSTLKVATTNCFWVITSWCTEGICPGGIDLDGKPCPYYAEKIDVYCISGGGSGSYEDYYNLDYPTFSETDNTSSGSGGSSTGNTMPAPEATTITICDDCIGFDELALKGFIYSLPSDTRAWFTATENLTFQSQTNSFLIKNNFSDEARAFAKDAAIAAHHNGEVDYPNKIIIDSTLIKNQRLDCVYNKFKNGTNTVASYLTNFLGEKPVGHLKFVVDDNFGTNYPDHTSAGAITFTPKDYIIKIVFNTDSSLASSESKMPTIVLGLEFIHEMIHAEMYRKLLDYAQKPEIPWSETFLDGLRNDFPGLSDYYTRYWLKLPPDQAPTDAQHQLMAQHYIETIKEALKDFDDGQHTDSFYTALAWTGLRKTVAWNKLAPSLQTEYINTLNTAIQNETHNCSN